MNTALWYHRQKGRLFVPFM